MRGLANRGGRGWLDRILPYVFSLLAIIVSFESYRTSRDAYDISARAEQKNNRIEQDKRLLRQIIDAEAKAVVECTAVVDCNWDTVINLYADDADMPSITDVDAKRIYIGKSDILDRYKQLDRHEKLVHVNLQFLYVDEPFALVNTNTSGVFTPQDGNQLPIPAVPREQWEFQKIDGSWKIKSFTYDNREHETR